MDQYVVFPGGVQWDGKHLAIGNQFTDIYEFAISGHHATTVGTTELGSGAMYVKQFWIQGQTVIAPNVYIKKSAQLLTSSMLIRPAARPLRRLRTASRVHKVRL